MEMLNLKIIIFNKINKNEFKDKFFINFNLKWLKVFYINLIFINFYNINYLFFYFYIK